jgi:hypothetical protein
MLPLRAKVWSLLLTLAFCTAGSWAAAQTPGAGEQRSVKLLEPEFAPTPLVDFDAGPGGYPGAERLATPPGSPTLPSPEPGLNTAFGPDELPAELFAPAVVITDEPGPQGCWRFLPEGMVPWIGPRTPPSRRARMIGQPLIGTSWRDRPVSFGFVAGALEGTSLESGRVAQAGPGFLFGVDAGWDYDYYWGIEKRLNYAALQISDPDGQHHRGATALFGEYRINYYPLGDTRWRPYLFAGPGVADFFYTNEQGQGLHRDQFLLAYGVGLKYLWTPSVAGRIEILDDYTIGTWSMSSMHNVSINAGLEMRFGEGTRWWHLFTRK